MVGFPKTLRLGLRFAHRQPHNPAEHAQRFRLLPFRSPLLRESNALSSPLGTKMFQFPRFPLTRVSGLCPHRPGSPIRTSRYQRPLPAPPGFSQVVTSFIGLGAEASTVCPFYLDLYSLLGLTPRIYVCLRLPYCPLFMIPAPLVSGATSILHNINHTCQYPQCPRSTLAGFELA